MGGDQHVDAPVSMPLRQAKACFSELVARADLVGTVTVLTKHGRPAAAIVPVTLLAELVALRAVVDGADERSGDASVAVQGRAG
ncbi:type II toxin-antitoxin system Phd/YefM family antitoxin [Virgisporangium aurantiacum]|nr:type II toxin-antitoxin system prevent-host-death family antitoxin [Virgisporangium aurantiacum]